ncbi:MAG: U32 family peptidase [Candidatus Aenigmatarchaeota archaeon]
MKKIELLSPAGSLPSLKAAICSGADAVYLGMNKFNARGSAVNFSEEDFADAIKLAKSNNVKVYLTMNTLIKNSEIKEFFEQLEYAYCNGIDAVIVQDPSFIEIIKNGFPGLRVHMSTQAGVMNSGHANLFSEADRINLARESSKENIKSIKDNFGKEIEIFVHGALCISVSGSCLFSSLMGGSGNRGKCVQPCRKFYNDSYLLSTKELCLIDKIPEIIGLGVDSIKIEGRMRTPYYVATTTAIYRQAIDMFYKGNFKITDAMRDELRNAFSREFTEGKFSGSPVFNTEKATGTSSIKEDILYDAKMKPFEIKKREPKLEIPELKYRQSSGKKLIARVYSLNDALIANKYANVICIDLFDKDFKAIRDQTQKPICAVTPRIMFDSDMSLIESRIREVKPEGLIAGNLGILKMNLGLPIILDYNSNGFNDLQLEYFKKLGVRAAIVSPELSIDQMALLKSKDFVALVHGKIRLMTLAHEMKEGKIWDDKGFDFTVRKIFNGTEIINGKEMGLFNKVKNLMSAGVNQMYVDTDQNVEAILSTYRQILDGKSPNASELQKDYVLGWAKYGTR